MPANPQHPQAEPLNHRTTEESEPTETHSISTADIRLEDHFVDITEMVTIEKGKQQHIHSAPRIISLTSPK